MVEPSRRDEIDQLLEDGARAFEPEVRVAAASVLALLEVANAIDRLEATVNQMGGEIEKLGWAVRKA